MGVQINDNKIGSLKDVEPQLKHITSLETIYLEGNPVQSAEGAHYRRKVILALPQISQLDATYVPTALDNFRYSHHSLDM